MAQGLIHAQFSNESEASLVSAGGNTESELFNLLTKNMYKLETSSISLGGHYTFGKANDEINARNWDVNLKYSHVLFKSFDWFFSEKVEGDRFMGFEIRYNTDLGIAHKFYESEKLKSHYDIGFRYLVQDNVDGTYDHENRLRFAPALTYELQKGTDLGGELEYLYDFEDGKDYFINFEAFLISKFYKNFSIKLGYKSTYRNIPIIEGNKNYDYTYSTALLAKL